MRLRRRRLPGSRAVGDGWMGSADPGHPLDGGLGEPQLRPITPELQSFRMDEIERGLEILEIVMREDPKATVWALPLILQQKDDEPWCSLRFRPNG